MKAKREDALSQVRYQYCHRWFALMILVILSHQSCSFVRFRKKIQEGGVFHRTVETYMDRRSRGRGLIDININLANEHELTLLPNVGPVLAKRIVEYRSQNGHFQTLADLMSVPGVGPKTVEIIQGIAILQP